MEDYSPGNKRNHNELQLLSNSPPRKKRKISNNNENISLKYPLIMPFSNEFIQSKEVIRIMIQTTKELGLYESAKILEKESNIKEEEEEITKFKIALLQGKWEYVLNSIPILSLSSDLYNKIIKWHIYRHCYLENIENNKTQNALDLLQNHINPLTNTIITLSNNQINILDNINYNLILKQLSSLLILNDMKSLKRIANWPGIKGGAREILLNDIYKYVDHSIMLPPGQLSRLLDQCVISHNDECFYHQFYNNTTITTSLLENNNCNESNISFNHIISKPIHNEEVWCLSFSHSGEYLASGYKDSSIIIWNTSIKSKGTIYKTILCNDTNGLHKLCWSKDDKIILICTCTQVYIYSLENDTIKKVFIDNTEKPKAIQSIVLYNENSFICGGLGQFVTQYSFEGNKIVTWNVVNVVDLDYNESKNIIACICQQQKINIILIDTNEIRTIQELSRISSVSISKNGLFILVHLFTQEIHLWNLQTKQLISHYYNKRSQNIIHIFLSAIFGGINDNFILSGGLDGSIYIWQRNGKLLTILREHSKPVTCIDWNFNRKSEDIIFASSGDDHKVILWNIKHNNKEM